MPHLPVNWIKLQLGILENLLKVPRGEHCNPQFRGAFLGIGTCSIFDKGFGSCWSKTTCRWLDGDCRPPTPVPAASHVPSRPVASTRGRGHLGSCCVSGFICPGLISTGLAGRTLCSAWWPLAAVGRRQRGAWRRLSAESGGPLCWRRGGCSTLEP